MAKTNLLPTLIITLFAAAACGGEDASSEVAFDTTRAAGTSGCSDCDDYNMSCQTPNLTVYDPPMNVLDITGGTYEEIDGSKVCDLVPADFISKLENGDIVIDVTVPSSCPVGDDGVLYIETASDTYGGVCS